MRSILLAEMLKVEFCVLLGYLTTSSFTSIEDLGMEESQVAEAKLTVIFNRIEMSKRVDLVET